MSEIKSLLFKNIDLVDEKTLMLAKILVEKLNDRNYPRRTRKMIQEERMERVRRLHTEQSDREEER